MIFFNDTQIYLSCWPSESDRDIAYLIFVYHVYRFLLCKLYIVWMYIVRIIGHKVSPWPNKYYLSLSLSAIFGMTIPFLDPDFFFVWFFVVASWERLKWDMFFYKHWVKGTLSNSLGVFNLAAPSPLRKRINIDKSKARLVAREENGNADWRAERNTAALREGEYEVRQTLSCVSRRNIQSKVKKKSTATVIEASHINSQPRLRKEKKNSAQFAKSIKRKKERCASLKCLERNGRNANHRSVSYPPLTRIFPYVTNFLYLFFPFLFLFLPHWAERFLLSLSLRKSLETPLGPRVFLAPGYSELPLWARETVVENAHARAR